LTQKKYAYWMANLPGVGDKSIRRLLAQMGDAEAVYRSFARRTAVKEKLLKQYGRILSEKQVESVLQHIREWDVEEEWKKLEEA